MPTWRQNLKNAGDKAWKGLDYVGSKVNRLSGKVGAEVKCLKCRIYSRDLFICLIQGFWPQPMALGED